MEILLVPNELLRQKANRLINITSEDIKIANQMMDTMTVSYTHLRAHET